MFRRKTIKKRKTTKWSNYNELHRFEVKTIKKFKVNTTQNYKSDQITMNCIDLTSKRSKQRKTTNAIKLRWIASIWHQNDQKCWVTSQNIQNNAKLRKWSNYNELHRFDVKTIKTFDATQNYKSDQITMNCIDLTSKRSKQRKTTKRDQIIMYCIDLTSKRSKMLSYVAKHSKQRKTTKVIKLQWLHRFDVKTIQKCWVMSQNIQNNAKLQNWSNYNELHRFDVKTIKKCWVTSHNIQNNAKLRNWSNYNALQRFEVKTI